MKKDPLVFVEDYLVIDLTVADWVSFVGAYASTLKAKTLGSLSYVPADGYADNSTFEVGVIKDQVYIYDTWYLTGHAKVAGSVVCLDSWYVDLSFERIDDYLAFSGVWESVVAVKHGGYTSLSFCDGVTIDACSLKQLSTYESSNLQVMVRSLGGLSLVGGEENSVAVEKLRGDVLIETDHSLVHVGKIDGAVGLGGFANELVLDNGIVVADVFGMNNKIATGGEADSFVFSTGSIANRADGGAGDDQFVFKSNSFANLAQGGDGDDIFVVKEGVFAATLTGGAGADIFSLAQGAGQVVITDYDAGEGDVLLFAGDVIDLAAAGVGPGDSFYEDGTWVLIL